MKLYTGTAQVENMGMMDFISEDYGTQVQDKEMLNTCCPVIENIPPPPPPHEGPKTIFFDAVSPWLSHYSEGFLNRLINILLKLHREVEGV